MVARVVEGRGRRQQLAGHGARRSARDRLRADGIGRRGFLRRQPDWRQPVRELPAGARRSHGAAHLALPVRQTRHLGPRPTVAAEPRHGSPERPLHRRRRPGHQARLSLSLRPDGRHAALSDRVPQVPVKRHPRRDDGRYPAAPVQATALCEADADSRDTDDTNAGGKRLGPRRTGEVPQRRPVRAVFRGSSDRCLSRIRRRS